ncbi:MAG: class I SAM-dependent methyltransferase [Chloroflexi bacterium]|nr:class I SAM-dependent methyltransferase [Chloroflexota bacterium]
MMAEERHIQAALERLASVLLDPALEKGADPLFGYYYKRSRMLTPLGLKRYLLESAAVFDLCRMEGGRVLDIGCGFGLRLLCYYLLGSGLSTGIDVSQEMVSTARVILKRFSDCAINIEQGDFLTYSLPPSSFAVVTMIEAISHIRDTKSLLEKIKDVLEDGGTLYIQDGNNDLFPLSRIRTRREWRRSEYGPIDKDMVQYGRAVDKVSALEGRKRIIQESFPILDGKTVTELAIKTRGLWGEEIRQAVGQFLETGKVASRKSFLGINPYTGEFPELGFSPFQLIGQLRSLGFQCRLLPPPSSIIRFAAPNPWKTAWVRLRSPLLRKAPQFLLPFLSGPFTILARKS